MATSLAAEIEAAYPSGGITLVESSGGVFEVRVDGDLIFSKKALQRHARPGEVLRLLKARAGGG